MITVVPALWQQWAQAHQRQLEMRQHSPSRAPSHIPQPGHPAVFRSIWAPYNTPHPKPSLVSSLLPWTANNKLFVPKIALWDFAIRNKAVLRKKYKLCYWHNLWKTSHWKTTHSDHCYALKMFPQFPSEHFSDIVSSTTQCQTVSSHHYWFLHFKDSTYFLALSSSYFITNL